MALFCKVFYKCNGRVKRLIRYSVSDIGINAFCRSASKCESFDFRDVATDDGRLQLVHDPKRGVRPKGGSACTDRVEQDRMLKLLRAVSCAEHSLDASLI